MFVQHNKAISALIKRKENEEFKNEPKEAEYVLRNMLNNCIKKDWNWLEQNVIAAKNLDLIKVPAADNTAVRTVEMTTDAEKAVEKFIGE